MFRATMGGGDTKFVPCTLQQLLSGDGQFYTTNYSTTMSTSFNSNQLPSDFNVLVPKNRPIHIFTEGVFDLFHYGHVRQLRQVKEAFPNVKVTAGVCSDELVRKYKGGPLVMTYEERIASVMECQYVDNVIDHGMFYPTIELLDRLEVTADLIAHDDIPYQCPDSDDCYKPFKDVDRFLTTERTQNISTTNLIQRIIDRLRLLRNLAARNLEMRYTGRSRSAPSLCPLTLLNTCIVFPGTNKGRNYRIDFQEIL
ncbi:unnamed protein product [Heligmosomoides polygyrus]|uniref:choline-phosphate cytidylyltransferase n=1 Tax=Heligmosomoides polygyrus TaxID=6339 RepID=A0A183G332_HELPZ|nr:unnamed protein product [Heligmosomoides polygyrus]